MSIDPLVLSKPTGNLNEYLLSKNILPQVTSVVYTKKNKLAHIREIKYSRKHSSPRSSLWLRLITNPFSSSNNDIDNTVVERSEWSKCYCWWELTRRASKSTQLFQSFIIWWLRKSLCCRSCVSINNFSIWEVNESKISYESYWFRFACCIEKM